MQTSRTCLFYVSRLVGSKQLLLDLSGGNSLHLYAPSCCFQSLPRHVCNECGKESMYEWVNQCLCRCPSPLARSGLSGPHAHCRACSFLISSSQHIRSRYVPTALLLHWQFALDQCVCKGSACLLTVVLKECWLASIPKSVSIPYSSCSFCAYDSHHHYIHEVSPPSAETVLWSWWQSHAKPKTKAISDCRDISWCNAFAFRHTMLLICCCD